MASVVDKDNATAKRKVPEPVSNGAAQAAEEESPDAKRRSILRSCIHEVALPPGWYLVKLDRIMLLTGRGSLDPVAQVVSPLSL